MFKNNPDEFKNGEEDHKEESDEDENDVSWTDIIGLDDSGWGRSLSGGLNVTLLLSPSLTGLVEVSSPNDEGQSSEYGNESQNEISGKGR
jgi:hypothetical protein